MYYGAANAKYLFSGVPFVPLRKNNNSILPQRKRNVLLQSPTYRFLGVPFRNVGIQNAELAENFDRCYVSFPFLYTFSDIQRPSSVVIGELLRSISAATWLQFLMVSDLDVTFSHQAPVPENPEKGLWLFCRFICRMVSGRRRTRWMQAFATREENPYGYAMS